jgi:uncharacterized protein (DUF427 family)
METAANPAPGFRSHPGHAVTIEPFAKHVTVRANGAVVASSDQAVLLKEHVYPPVIYIPFADIDFGKLAATDTSTHCPFKGDASYWSVKDGAKDAMWAYRDPYDEMSEIKDHGAFYPNRVTIETE